MSVTAAGDDGVVIKRRIKIIKESFITPEHSWQWMRESTFIECVAKRPPSKPTRACIYNKYYIHVCAFVTVAEGGFSLYALKPLFVAQNKTIEDLII